MEINQVVLFGRLGKDPELRSMPNGDPLCSFALANSTWKKEGEKWVESTSWFDCTIFGKQAPAFCERAKKGHRIIITGSLKQRVWKNKDDERQERVSINVFGIQYLEKKAKSDAVPEAVVSSQTDVPF